MGPFAGFSGEERSTFVLAFSLFVALLVFSIVFISPVAELTGIISLVAVLPILQVLISGIINLNLLIS